MNRSDTNFYLKQEMSLDCIRFDGTTLEAEELSAYLLPEKIRR